MRRIVRDGVMPARVAEALGVPLVEPNGLDLDSVDVVYRRIDADRLDTPVGRLLSPAARRVPANVNGGI